MSICGSAASTLWFAPLSNSKRHRELVSWSTADVQVFRIDSGVSAGRGMNSLTVEVEEEFES